MTAETSEDAGLSIPLCLSNGTCASQLNPFFPPFSSTFALIVLVAVIIGIIFVSLATFHFHKRKLRKRKIQRAQEEYERDSRSGTGGTGGTRGARGTREPVNPCVIVRPVSRDTETSTPSDAQKSEEKPSCQIQENDDLTVGHNVSTPDTAASDPGDGQILHTVISS